MPQGDQTADISSQEEPGMAELVAYFTGELAGRVRLLRDAADAGCVDTVRRLAHQLKGAAPGFGFPAIGRAAGELERSLAADVAGSSAVDRARVELEALIEICQSHARPV